MADALPSADPIKLHETEHPGVTDQGKSKPHQESSRENQSGRALATASGVGLSLLSVLSTGNIALTPGALSLRADVLHSDTFAIQPFGAFGWSEIQMHPHKRGGADQSHGCGGPFQHWLITSTGLIPLLPIARLRTRVSYDAPRVWDNADPSSRI
jgi:hypothetical protein